MENFKHTEQTRTIRRRNVVDECLLYRAIENENFESVYTTGRIDESYGCFTKILEYYISRNCLLATRLVKEMEDTKLCPANNRYKQVHHTDKVNTAKKGYYHNCINVNSRRTKRDGPSLITQWARTCVIWEFRCRLVRGW